MKKNVELEFINKVKELHEKMQDLTFFWHENENELENVDLSKNYLFDDLTNFWQGKKDLEEPNVCKGYFSYKTFDDLTFNVNNWLLVLINSYCQKDPLVFFEAYYKSLQK